MSGVAGVLVVVEKMKRKRKRKRQTTMGSMWYSRSRHCCGPHRLPRGDDIDVEQNEDCGDEGEGCVSCLFTTFSRLSNV